MNTLILLAAMAQCTGTYCPRPIGGVPVVRTAYTQGGTAYVAPGWVQTVTPPVGTVTSSVAPAPVATSTNFGVSISYSYVSPGPGTFGYYVGPAQTTYYVPTPVYVQAPYPAYYVGPYGGVGACGVAGVPAMGGYAAVPTACGAGRPGVLRGMGRALFGANGGCP